MCLLRRAAPDPHCARIVLSCFCVKVWSAALIAHPFYFCGDFAQYHVERVGEIEGTALCSAVFYLCMRGQRVKQDWLLRRLSLWYEDGNKLLIECTHSTLSRELVAYFVPILSYLLHYR
jgi:hypothetical protein